MRNPCMIRVKKFTSRAHRLLSVRKKLPTMHTGQVIHSKILSSVRSARVIHAKTIRQPFTSKDLSNDYSFAFMIIIMGLTQITSGVYTL